MTFILPAAAERVAKLCEVVNDEVRYQVRVETRIAILPTTSLLYDSAWTRSSCAELDYLVTSLPVIYDWEDIFIYGMTPITMLDFQVSEGHVETIPCFMFKIPKDARQKNQVCIIVSADDVFMVKK